MTQSTRVLFNVDAEERLQAWGWWSQNSGLGLGHKPKTNFAIIKSQNAFAITDDEALEIDALLAALQRAESPLYYVAIYYFLHRLTTREAAQQMQIGETLFRSLKDNLISYVQGALYPHV